MKSTEMPVKKIRRERISLCRGQWQELLKSHGERKQMPSEGGHKKTTKTVGSRAAHWSPLGGQWRLCRTIADKEESQSEGILQACVSYIPWHSIPSCKSVTVQR